MSFSLCLISLSVTLSDILSQELTLFILCSFLPFTSIWIFSHCFGLCSFDSSLCSFSSVISSSTFLPEQMHSSFLDLATTFPCCGNATLGLPGVFLIVLQVMHFFTTSGSKPFTLLLLKCFKKKCFKPFRNLNKVFPFLCADITWIFFSFSFSYLSSY